MWIYDREETHIDPWLERQGQIVIEKMIEPGGSKVEVLLHRSTKTRQVGKVTFPWGRDGL